MPFLYKDYESGSVEAFVGMITHELTKNKERNYRIDNLRFIAIIIVVLGHSIIIYDPTWGIIKTDIACEPLRILKKLINVIQMPLFFAMSGYLYTSSIERYDLRTIIAKKFVRLIVPFVSILFLFSDPIKFLLEVPGYETVTPILKQHLFFDQLGHLWFLPTLFECFILTYIPFQRKYAKYSIMFFGIFFMLHILSVYVPNCFQQKNVLFYCVYFVVGIMMKRYESIIRSVCLKKFFLTTIIAMLFFVQFLLPQFLKMFCIIGIIVGLYLILPTRTSKLISIIASCSFGIYLLHSPLVYITYSFLPNHPPLLIFLINFVFFGAVALLTTYYIQATKVKFLLGF